MVTKTMKIDGVTITAKMDKKPKKAPVKSRSTGKRGRPSKLKGAPFTGNHASSKRYKDSASAHRAPSYKGYRKIVKTAGGGKYKVYYQKRGK